MAKSIFGFSQGISGSGGTGVTDAIRRYNIAINNAKNESGYIEDPTVYQKARETYLEPYADDLRASLKISESINEETRLLDRVNDAQLATSVIESDVNDALRDYQKAFYKAPGQLINSTAYVYGQTVARIEDEIYSRQGTGQAIGDLQVLLNKYEEKERVAVRIARDTLAGGVRNPNAYGWFIRTNPNDGSIIGIEVDTSQASNKIQGYKRTDSMYAGLPVFVETYLDENGKESARIGSNKFQINDETKLLERDIKASTGERGKIFKGYLPGGESPDEYKSRVRDINLNSIEFGDVYNAPKDSLARDSRGNYYYHGGDGWYKASNVDDLKQFFDVSGINISKDDINNRALPISSEEVKSFGSFSDEKGNTRIIDKSLIESFTTGVQNKPVSLLPSMDKSVTGTFSAAPNPLVEAYQQTYNQVPRKKTAMKTPSQVSSSSTKDFLGDVASTLGQKFSPLVEGAKNLFKA